MMSLPQEAPHGVRQAILEALKHDDFSIHEGPDTHVLQSLGFDLHGLATDLADYLKDGCRLYLLQGPSVKGTRYQCCLSYEESITVHVKITLLQSDEGFAAYVKLGFHKHNTGYPPLPC